jgi:hypothetical protein
MLLFEAFALNVSTVILILICGITGIIAYGLMGGREAKA